MWLEFNGIFIEEEYESFTNAGDCWFFWADVLDIIAIACKWMFSWRS